jgi:hypothetical protein
LPVLAVDEHRPLPHLPHGDKLEVRVFHLFLVLKETVGIPDSNILYAHYGRALAQSFHQHLAIG